MLQSAPESMEVDTSNDNESNENNGNDTQLLHQPLTTLSPMDSSDAALLAANELLSHQIDGERKVENAFLLKRPDLKGLSLIFTLFHTFVVTFSAVLMISSRPSPYFALCTNLPSPSLNPLQKGSKKGTNIGD